jgi:hypothetical protein
MVKVYFDNFDVEILNEPMIDVQSLNYFYDIFADGFVMD